mgnify:CR=1 FL=1
MAIQWFPGHMAKARREITEKLTFIDIVFELVDARIPMSSRNPMIDDIVGHKPRLVLLNKEDMADRNVTKEWQRYFSERNIETLSINSQKGKGISMLAQKAKQLAKGKLEKMAAKGMRPRAIRALILGIPNVGKSTLINRLANKKIAQTGDRPGITKQQQWIKVGKELELLDTPGILWPKFDDAAIGFRLAATGAIKDDLFDFQEVAVFLLRFLQERYPESLMERYRLVDVEKEPLELLEAIANRRGLVISGGEADYDRSAEMLIREFRSEKLGRISLERPGDIS